MRPTSLDEYLGEALRDPGFRAAYEDVEARSRLRDGLVAARRRLGLARDEVARRMDAAPSLVSDFERGCGDPYLSVLQRYARVVGLRLAISVEELPAERGER